MPEETFPKTMATCIRNEKFLNFFFSRLRWTNDEEIEYLSNLSFAGTTATGTISDEGQEQGENINSSSSSSSFSSSCHVDYPFVSPCGKEINFIRPAATPIVFHTLDDYNRTIISPRNETQDDAIATLRYAGSRSIPFDHTQLAISKQTGALYHRFDPTSSGMISKGKSATKRRSISDNTSTDKFSTIRHGSSGKCLEYGLIRSSIAMTISENIHFSNDDDDHDHEVDDGDRLYYCDSNGCLQPIEWLPDDAEPGPWSMPSLD